MDQGIFSIKAHAHGDVSRLMGGKRFSDEEVQEIADGLLHRYLSTVDFLTECPLDAEEMRHLADVMSATFCKKATSLYLKNPWVWDAGEYADVAASASEVKQETADPN